jgi:DNA-directed RNA polymerase specialized sigma subunit
MKRERDPTPEEFEKLLLWLDPDRDQAARKLLLIQARMTKILISRGCVDAEMVSDEVTNRIAVRIDKVKESYPEQTRCFIGFLDKVYQEYIRDYWKEHGVEPPPPPRSSEVLEQEDRCLKKCLAQLPSKERNIVERYFGDDGPKRREERKKLIIELNMTPNALRIQAHRLRKKTLKCLRGCLGEAEAKR